MIRQLPAEEKLALPGKTPVPGETPQQVLARSEAYAKQAHPSVENNVIKSFNKSTGQKKVGNFELGSFGKNSIGRKVVQIDRFPINELEETQKYIISFAPKGNKRKGKKKGKTF